MKYSPRTEKAPADLITEVELAARLNVSRSYLRKMRSEGVGPKYYKLGVAIRYSATDADAWLEAQSVAA